jgi:hypothetical protein
VLDETQTHMKRAPGMVAKPAPTWGTYSSSCATLLLPLARELPDSFPCLAASSLCSQAA